MAPKVSIFGYFWENWPYHDGTTLCNTFNLTQYYTEQDTDNLVSAEERSECKLTKTQHSSPSRVSYGVSFESILERYQYVMTRF